MTASNDTTARIRTAFDDRRAALIRAGDRIRLLAVAGFTAVHVVLGYVGAHPNWHGNLSLWLTYLALTLAVFAVDRHSGTIARLGGIVIPLVDMPMIFVLQSALAPQGDDPTAIVAFTAAPYVMLVMWSALTLDRRLIALTALAAALLQSGGLLQEADGATLFIDEVALLPAAAQHLLLLPVEGRPFRPAVGTGPELRVDVKLIFATNRDLADDVEHGLFPRDLYERIAGETLRVPPLRERHGDVPLLAAHLLARLQEELGAVPTLSAAAAARLERHDWPGNVRELRRILRQAARRAQLDESPAIEVAHLPDGLGAPGRAPAGPSGSEGFSERETAELAALRAAAFRVAVAESRLGYSGRSRTLSHRLRGLSFKALKLAGWDVDTAAALLAGEDGELSARVARRLRALLAGLSERRDEPPEKLLAHLLAEHRPFALEALTRARAP